MTHCCSQCNFTAQFESALMMHRQLHHEKSDDTVMDLKRGTFKEEKSKTTPRNFMSGSANLFNKNLKGLKLPNRTSSATRLFDKLRARVCRSKILSIHAEESADSTFQDLTANETCADLTSDCTSKALKAEASRISVITALQTKEIFSCHLCKFDADRITVLDRHLLNDHKINLENLLKLVMAKTKEGLIESAGPVAYGIRQPYYKAAVDIMGEGEFIVETVTPKVKILKHASTNTDTQGTDAISDLKHNYQMITEKLEKLLNQTSEKSDKDSFIEKMQVLNECMCKFVDSSNTLKRTLTREFGSKNSVHERANFDSPYFNLCLGEDSPRDWERPHSEQMERSRSKYRDNSRGEKKLVAESFYF